jgi:DNA polymerase-3 subunit chi
MTRIDFYILSERAGDRLLFTCRLADKIYTQGHALYIHTASQEQAVQLDELLWTFSPGNFLPHDLHQPAHGAPIQIGYADNPFTDTDAAGDGQVLINLADHVPLFFSRYARVAEIVDPHEARKAAGRERFRFYRERGYALESHTI